MPYGRRRRFTRRVRPARRTARYASRKRTYRRKAGRAPRAFRTKWASAISQRRLVKFTYADSTFSRTLNVGNGYSSYYVFRGIGPYDPDLTGVGVQPYGWDDYVGQYKFSNYICRASKISVYFRPEAAHADIRRLHVSVCACRDYAPVMTDISDVRMMPLRKATCYDGNTEGTKGAILSLYATTKRVCWVQGNDYSAEGSYSAPPGIGWYWIVHFYTDVFTSAEELDVYFDVKIKYYTALSRGKEPEES